MTQIIRLERVDSTQATIFALAATGAADRTVVVADYQAAGRGRRGRAWDAAPGQSLLTSILLRPRLSPAQWPAYSLVTAVAVAETLARMAALAARLKWPNDVLIGGRKIAGILLESRAVGDAAAAVIAIGVGVNLTQRAFPAGLAARATSVAIETGRAVSAEAVLTALLEAFDHWRARVEADGMAPVRARWLSLADTIGRRVSVDGVSGVAVDLDPDGALVLEDGGRRHRVVAGEVGDEPEHAARR
ncbi:MAG TPA: biotin--[acetyl-CoA-carboxylase] ligase [Methylomirabilota bacterium]|jgi:BirA family biotin operon repressor/biotin-[acetyl-CoA-carboxylase] ligase|nr:biotin--[acetyl-CoA-carboxylase] ligase [Methylomirabilota bacterium]